MSKEINYPIKYAILELKEKGSWQEGYENITYGFIVSKCYVVESSIVYHSDGSNKITHKVVFPFNDISLFKNSLKTGRQNIGSENIPCYDACNRPYPINIVTDLFDSYEEAKVIAVQKNKEFKDNLVSNVPASKLTKFQKLNWKEKFEILEQEFNQRLELCNCYEQQLLAITEDISISDQLFEDTKKSTIKVLKPIKKTI